jgi:hypothetical protein
VRREFSPCQLLIENLEPQHQPRDTVNRDPLCRGRLAPEMLDKLGLGGAQVSPLFRASVDPRADHSAIKRARMRAKRTDTGGRSGVFHEPNIARLSPNVLYILYVG